MKQATVFITLSVIQRHLTFINIPFVDSARQHSQGSSFAWSWNLIRVGRLTYTQDHNIKEENTLAPRNAGLALCKDLMQLYKSMTLCPRDILGGSD